MKVKITDRILLALYALLGIAGAAAFALLGWYKDSVAFTVAGNTVTLASGVWTAVALFAIAAALLAWSIWTLVLAFRHEPKIDRSSVSIQNTENGAVRISVAAMDTLVKQAIGHQEGLLDVQTKVINHEDSISVSVVMKISSDVHIPNITMLMQRAIKNYIEEFSGIAVREVTVMVTSVVEAPPAPLAIEEKPAAPDVVVTPPPAPETVVESEPEEDAPVLEPETISDPQPMPTEPEAEAEAEPEAEPEEAAEPIAEEPVPVEEPAAEEEQASEEAAAPAEEPIPAEPASEEGKEDKEDEDDFNEKDLW